MRAQRWADLSPPQIRLTHEEEIIEAPLFPPALVAFVIPKLRVAQAFQNFAIPASLMKDFLLHIAQILQTKQLAFNRRPLLAHPGLALKGKDQFGRSRARG